MGDVVANVPLSLDGYVEDAGSGVDQVFAWLYGSGEAVVTSPGDEREFRTSVASADIAQQCLNLGLLDAITVDLVPVLLGSGTPFFANLHRPVALGIPTVVEGHGVTHLRFRVQGMA